MLSLQKSWQIFYGGDVRQVSMLVVWSLHHDDHAVKNKYIPFLFALKFCKVPDTFDRSQSTQLPLNNTPCPNQFVKDSKIDNDPS